MAKGNETRETILTAALAQASKLGLEGLSIGTLAREVGLSKSGLFAHFNSLENLQLAVLEKATARFIELVIAPALHKPRGKPRIQALLDNFANWAQADFMPGGCLFIAAANELDDRPGPVRDYLVSTQKDFLATIATAARIAIEEGHFRKDLDADQFAFEFYAIMLGYHHFHRLLRDAKAGKRMQRAAAALIKSSCP